MLQLAACANLQHVRLLQLVAGHQSERSRGPRRLLHGSGAEGPGSLERSSGATASLGGCRGFPAKRTRGPPMVEWSEDPRAPLFYKGSHAGDAADSSRVDMSGGFLVVNFSRKYIEST